VNNSAAPTAYLENEAYFYDKEFYIDENVLIPRFDTERLVENILKNEGSDNKFVLELGTGSGIICEILREHRPNWRFVSVDISEKALNVAKKNVAPAITLINSDKFSAILPNNQFDIIVSNPPYIESATIATLDESVKNFEPLIALDGGEDGLDFYRYIANNAKNFLKSGGIVYCEIGYNQGESVPKVFEENSLKNIKIYKDYGQNNRVVSAKFQ
jgi:release factor glutamine methyltransferase